MAKKNRIIPNLTPQDVESFWSYVDKTPGLGPQGKCWEWRGPSLKKGYGTFRRKLAHRVAYFIETGQQPGDMDVCHHCDNPACVNFSDLFLGTRLDNMRDCITKGRHAHGDTHGLRKHPERAASGERHGSKTKPESRVRGDKNGARKNRELIKQRTIEYWREHPEKVRRGKENPAAKLTDDLVREIRKRLAAGAVQRQLAIEYGIGVHAMFCIAQRRTWKHVTD